MVLEVLVAAILVLICILLWKNNHNQRLHAIAFIFFSSRLTLLERVKNLHHDTETSVDFSELKPIMLSMYDYEDQAELLDEMSATIRRAWKELNDARTLEIDRENWIVTVCDK